MSEPLSKSQIVHVGRACNTKLTDKCGDLATEVFETLNDVMDRYEGVVEENKGLVEENKGLVEENEGLVEENKGLVEENEGLKERLAELKAQLNGKPNASLKCSKCGQSARKDHQTRLVRYVKHLDSIGVVFTGAVCPTCVFQPYGLTYCGTCKAPHRDEAAQVGTHADRRTAANLVALGCQLPSCKKRPRQSHAEDEHAQKRPRRS